MLQTDSDSMVSKQDNAVNLAKDKQQLATNNDRLRKEINVLRHQLQEAQSNFEREVSCTVDGQLVYFRCISQPFLKLFHTFAGD